MKKTEINEMLLSSWLGLSAAVRNDRMVKSMSFNEIFVCNILSNAPTDIEVSAGDIAVKTGMLKSQVNRVLTDLENKGFISRCGCAADKRKTLLTLTKAGKEAYQKEHGDILLILDNLRKRLGDEEITRATLMFGQIAEAMQDINKQKELI